MSHSSSSAAKDGPSGSTGSATRMITNRWSTVLPHTDRPGERGSVRRSHDASLHPELGVRGCRTLYETIRHGAAANPLGPCLGFRAVSATGHATPYVYQSYAEILARVEALAAGLEALGLVPPVPQAGAFLGAGCNSSNLKLLGLYLPNCVEWVLAEHAIFTVGGATVPFYDTLGPLSLEYILKHTGLKTLVCTRQQLKHVCEAAPNCPSFTTALLADGVTPDAHALAQQAGVEVLALAKVEAIGAETIATTGHRHSPPSSDDIATFSYTSGTTGTPKGALLTHGNLIAAIAGLTGLCEDIRLELSDRHLSYMPLAHIFERNVLAQILWAGGSVAFYRNDPIYLIEDLQACRPTVMIVAPRVLNKIHDKIQNGMAAVGGAKERLFRAAVRAKAANLRKRNQLHHGLYDRLIFRKIARGLGMDHVRLMISGSAPIGENVMTFFRCMLGVPIVEGYGQTEGCAGATLGHPDDMATVGHVGGPIACVEIALYDVPEMGYLHEDTSHHGHLCQGRGEICIRGPNVFLGYYKDEEKTRETIDKEGWLHSGDIGLWRPDGTLQIIDRKKNIFKLSQGEYVAPEKIENVLTHSPFVAQCFVYGDSLQSALVAIVVPEEEVVRGWAANREGMSASDSFASLCQSPALKETIMEEIQRMSKESQLQGFETVKAIHLQSDLFSAQNDTMTPTFKLKRQTIRDMNEQVINDLYAKMPPPRSKL